MCNRDSIRTYYIMAGYMDWRIIMRYVLVGMFVFILMIYQCSGMSGMVDAQATIAYQWSQSQPTWSDIQHRRALIQAESYKLGVPSPFQNAY